MCELQSIDDTGGFQSLWYIFYGNILKGIVSDSNNIFLWHESEDIYKKCYFQNFSWFQFYTYKLCMIMCIGSAP